MTAAGESVSAAGVLLHVCSVSAEHASCSHTASLPHPALALPQLAAALPPCSCGERHALLHSISHMVSPALFLSPQERLSSAAMRRQMRLRAVVERAAHRHAQVRARAARAQANDQRLAAQLAECLQRAAAARDARLAAVAGRAAEAVSCPVSTCNGVSTE